MHTSTNPPPPTPSVQCVQSVCLYPSLRENDPSRSRTLERKKSNSFLLLACFISDLICDLTFIRIWFEFITRGFTSNIVIRFRLPASHPSTSGFLLHSGTLFGTVPSFRSIYLCIYDFRLQFLFFVLHRVFFFSSGWPP